MHYFQAIWNFSIFLLKCQTALMAFFLGSTFALYSIYISSPLFISSVIIFYCLFYNIICYQYCVHLCYFVLLLLYWHCIKCSFSTVLSLLLFRANITPFALYSWFTLFHWRELKKLKINSWIFNIKVFILLFVKRKLTNMYLKSFV